MGALFYRKCGYKGGRKVLLYINNMNTSSYFCFRLFTKQYVLMYNIFLISLLLYFKTYSLLTTLFVFYAYIRTLLCVSLCTKNYYSSNQVYKGTLQLLSRQREHSLSKNCTFLCSARRGAHCSPAGLTMQRLFWKASHMANGHGRALLAPI